MDNKFSSTWAELTSDWRVNSSRPHIQTLLFLFRLAHLLRQKKGLAKYAGIIVSIIYRTLALFAYSIDIPTRTKIGPGLAVHHGFGIVVHADAGLGSRNILRQGVTIGARRGEDVPTSGNNVEFGANSMVLGSVHIGDGCTIGAGAVLLTDLPQNASAVGNPARLLSARELRFE